MKSEHNLSTKQKNGKGVIFFVAPDLHAKFKTLLASRRQTIQAWGEKALNRELAKGNK